MRRLLRSMYGTSIVLAMNVTLGGCGESVDDLPREPVRGKVTIDGEPLARGAIQFRMASAGVPGSVEVGELIRDGEYQIPRGQGPVPGTYTVTITEETERVAPTKDPFGSRAGMKKSRIPAKYNQPPGLTAEVKKGQADPLDFALTTR
jgi:hypothetical protein